MEKIPPPWTLGDLAALFGGDLHGPASFTVQRPAPSGSDDPTGIGFAKNDKYLATAEASNIGALFLAPGLSSKKPSIVVKNPQACFGALLSFSHRPLPLASGIHPTAVIDETASVDPSAFVGAFSVVERGARILAKARVFAHCYVGEGCVLGEGATLFPHAVLYQDVHIGARSIVHSGAILGADGFGYVWDGKQRVKVHQIGSVEVGEDVEIGALTAVDRATAGATVLEDGVKLDNFVQVAHNVRIGEHTVIAAFGGISGSSRLGARNTLAGKVDIVDHVSTADDVTLGGRTAVATNIKEPGVYLGAPAQPALEASKSLIIATKLPELLARIRKLEKEIEGLKK
jgi:UDP-3-O-[3-hydroxymyristoyl] glucosamine N-acyltransferase